MHHSIFKMLNFHRAKVEIDWNLGFKRHYYRLSTLTLPYYLLHSYCKYPHRTSPHILPDKKLLKQLKQIISDFSLSPGDNEKLKTKSTYIPQSKCDACHCELDIFNVCVYISNFLYLEIPESIRFILYECLILDASVAQFPCPIHLCAVLLYTTVRLYNCISIQQCCDGTAVQLCCAAYLYNCTAALCIVAAQLQYICSLCCDISAAQYCTTVQWCTAVQ